MLNQTIDNLIPLLSMLQQPAFCIAADGSVHSNAAASRLAPLHGDRLPIWLGEHAETYGHWDRNGQLELTVSVREQPYTVCIRPVQDGTLFLLTALTVPDSVDAALTVTAQILRQPLSELSILAQRAARQNPTEHTAAITRKIYQLTRLAGNLSDLGQLHNGTYRMHMEMKEVSEFLTPLMQELEVLCADLGRTLQWALPEKSAMIPADFMLLERAILNLISNAIKFGVKTEPIVFRAECTAGHLLLKVSNRCSGNGSDLLRAAFSRLEQRDLLPDPRWGIGLGLPITRYIAALHNGMVAVEVSNESIATVTMAVSRKRPLVPSVLTTPSIPFEYSGGMRRTLVELAELLPNTAFEADGL